MQLTEIMDWTGFPMLLPGSRQPDSRSTQKCVKDRVIIIVVKGREQLLRRRENSYRTLEITREVATITPYNAQITELEANIQPAGPDWQALKIEIAVIDAFQGRDRDIVLYSTVRSNKNAHLGFLRDRRRLNVALSRARQLLILVGDVWTLENGRASADGNPYQDLVKYIRENPQDYALEDLEGQ
jgi:superfamily I DNA and/or RNA helicase